MTKTPKGWQDHIESLPSEQKAKVRHLTSSIETLKGGAAKRAKPRADFILTVFTGHAVLQGARGKTIAHFYGTPEACEKHARAVIPAGKTLEVDK